MSLSQEFIDKIKNRLLEDKAKIEEQLEDFSGKTDEGGKVSFPQYGDHQGENASEVATYDSDLSVRQTLKKSLRDINSSLNRISEGTYGTCKYCRQDISEGRLNIRPTSSACINCKQSFTK